MIFKLVNWTVMGIALFYGAEGVGLLEKGKFFPTLPRLEARASDPMAWLGAAQWGFSQLGQFAQSNGGADFSTGSLASVSDNPTFRNITDRISRSSGGGGGTNYLSGYGG